MKWGIAIILFVMVVVQPACFAIVSQLNLANRAEVQRLKSLIDQHSRDRLEEAGKWTAADVRLYLGANPEPASDPANPPHQPIREKK